MKKTLVIFVALLWSVNVWSQTINDGIKMYNYERYQSAEKILAPLAAGNPMANYYLGLCQLADGKLSDAKASFGKFPEDVANMSGMARAAYAENNATQAMQILQTVVSKAKKKDWEPFKYAADAINYSDNASANIQQAIDWYKTALQKTDDADVHIALGDAYQKMQGGGGEAMNNYEHVSDKDPKNSLVFYRIGALWYAAHAYPDALTNYNKAKDADPSNPLPYRDLAYVYERVAKYEEALSNDKKYLDLSDNSCEDKIHNAEILYLAKHYPEAIAAANEIIAKCPVSPAIYGILGFSQQKSNDTVNALKNAGRYIQTQAPKKITTDDYLNYAWILLMNKQTDSANFYFNRTLQSDSAKDKSDIYRQIAEGFKTNKDYPKSAMWYSRMISENPATGAADYAWATIMYYYAKDYPNAAKTAEQWEAKYPDPPSGTYWRGRVAAAVDNEAKEGSAIPFFDKWLGIVGPNHDKKNDLKTAYDYELLYYFNKENKEKIKEFEDKISAIDPNDDLLKQIQDFEKKTEEHDKAVKKAGQKAK